MWKLDNDEFLYEETVPISAPLPLVYQTVASVEKYEEFLTDVILSEKEGTSGCHMIIRAGPLRVEVRTRVEYVENQKVVFTLVEGPPLELLAGAWEVSPNSESGTDVTFRVNIKAGRAGNWFLNAAAKYVDHMGMTLIDSFKERILFQQGDTIALPEPKYQKLRKLFHALIYYLKSVQAFFAKIMRNIFAFLKSQSD
jgi:ribosome-associated toxin RatA of RatAB toxin-antitoxin module